MQPCTRSGETDFFGRGNSTGAPRREPECRLARGRVPQAGSRVTGWVEERTVRLKPLVLGDHRREHLRFEMMGTTVGSIVATQMLRVLELAASGALVEAAWPLAVNAEHQMQLVLDRHVSEVTAKVRRVVEITTVVPPRYRIALEFLTISPEASDEIDRFVVASLGADTPAET